MGNYENAINFYLLATKLKYKIRSGWDENHWNITSERIESIAEHVYGTCILAISLDSEFFCGVILEKVLKMLVIHEIGEVVIGDITPFDNITPSEKNRIEHEAVIRIVGDLIKKDEIISLIFEFDEEETREAKFAHYCDKLEADIQAKIYQDEGYQRSLDDQSHNVVFKSPKINDIINNGAQTAFDVWYEWDKNIYPKDSVFSRTLKYVKDNNTNIK